MHVFCFSLNFLPLILASSMHWAFGLNSRNSLSSLFSLHCRIKLKLPKVCRQSLSKVRCELEDTGKLSPSVHVKVTQLHELFQQATLSRCFHERNDLWALPIFGSGHKCDFRFRSKGTCVFKPTSLPPACHFCQGMCAINKGSRAGWETNYNKHIRCR